MRPAAQTGPRPPRPDPRPAHTRRPARPAQPPGPAPPAAGIRTTAASWPPPRRATAPGLLDQPAGRHHPARLQHQQRQHRPRPRPAQRDLTAGPQHLHRAQQPHLKRHGPARTRPVIPGHEKIVRPARHPPQHQAACRPAQLKGSLTIALAQRAMPPGASPAGQPTASQIPACGRAQHDSNQTATPFADPVSKPTSRPIRRKPSRWPPTTSQSPKDSGFPNSPTVVFREAHRNNTEESRWPNQ